MANKKRIPGVRRRVRTTSGKLYTQQKIRNGRTVYRRGGRFVSKRAFVSAKASKGAETEATELWRARDTPDRIEARTKWVIDEPGTEFGFAGEFATDILPGVKKGDQLTEAQRRELFDNMRMIRGFEAFWHFSHSDMSRENAEDMFLEMLDKLRETRDDAERQKIRVSFGLDGSSGMEPYARSKTQKPLVK